MVRLINKIEDDLAQKLCQKFDHQAQALLEILHEIQTARGYIHEAALRTLAYELNISRAEIYGVVSFYHDFKRQPAPYLSLKICRAEACQAVGAQALIDSAEQAFATRLDAPEKHDKIALESVFCLGNCALGPAVLCQDQLYGRVDMACLEKIVAISS